METVTTPTIFVDVIGTAATAADPKKVTPTAATVCVMIHVTPNIMVESAVKFL